MLLLSEKEKVFHVVYSFVEEYRKTNGIKMPKSTINTAHNTNNNDNDDDDSENEFSDDNSNLSEINPLVLTAQASLLRSASQLSASAPQQFNQNSSSSTASSVNQSNNNNNLNNNNGSNSSITTAAQLNNQNQNSNASNNSSNKDKKFRHQNFSKNIYIGTKNAEKWDNLRNLFHFKNDVEFVSFLLNSAENEARSNKNG